MSPVGQPLPGLGFQLLSECSQVKRRRVELGRGGFPSLGTADTLTEMFVVGSWPVCIVECLAASLAYFGTPQNNTHVAFESLMDIEWWNMSHKYAFPAEIKAPPSCFGFYTINKCLSWGLFIDGFFFLHFCAFCRQSHCLKLSPGIVVKRRLGFLKAGRR